MGKLIKEELRELLLMRNKRKLIIAYGFIAMVFPFIIWLLGPGLAGFYDMENFSLYVSISGMIFVMGKISNTLEGDGARRKINFLQTLPVTKSQIVSAKFIAVLSLNGITIVWMNVIILLSIFLSGGNMNEAALMLTYFSSLNIFTTAVTLLRFFHKGPRPTFLIWVLSMFIWGGVFFFAASLMRSSGMTPDILIFGLLIILSLMIYLICWWQAVRKINKKGFPLHEASKKGQKGTLEGGTT